MTPPSLYFFTSYKTARHKKHLPGDTTGSKPANKSKRRLRSDSSCHAITLDCAEYWRREVVKPKP